MLSASHHDSSEAVGSTELWKGTWQLNRLHSLLVMFFAVTAGCGGSSSGGGGSSNPPPPPPPSNASPGGIWEGTSSNGTTLLGLVTETGEFFFIQSDGVQYVGHADTTENELSVRFSGVTAFGTTFPDGSTSGDGTLTGTVGERSTITGDAHFSTELGTNADSTITLSYNNLYDRNSSLTLIAGNYRDPDTDAIINVNSNGVIFSQDAVTGCVINGQADVIDPAFNAYDVRYQFSSCLGSAAILNGTSTIGWATLDNTVVPEVAIIGVVNLEAGYGFTGVFPRA